MVLAGYGIDVDGSGNVNDPYVITAEGIAASFTVQDTDTVDLVASGAGTAADPYLLSANATVPLTGLSDRDTTVAPQDGWVPRWAGTKWVFSAPPVVPAGATNVGPGLAGDGSIATPLQVATSGTWGTGPLAPGAVGTDSLAGPVIYVDSAGQLRAQPIVNQSVAWNNITGKPTSFPSSWNNITGKPVTYPTVWTQVADRPWLASGSFSTLALAPGADARGTEFFDEPWSGSTPPVIIVNVNATLLVQIRVVSPTSFSWVATNVGRVGTPTVTFYWVGIRPAGNPGVVP